MSLPLQSWCAAWLIWARVILDEVLFRFLTLVIGTPLELRETSLSSNMPAKCVNKVYALPKTLPWKSAECWGSKEKVRRSKKGIFPSISWIVLTHGFPSSFLSAFHRRDTVDLKKSPVQTSLQETLPCASTCKSACSSSPHRMCGTVKGPVCASNVDKSPEVAFHATERSSLLPNLKLSL